MQVLPFFKGAAGTGKSTIVNYVIKPMYAKDDVGTLSNNIEKTFGLSNLSEKYIIVAPEVKADLRLEQADKYKGLCWFKGCNMHTETSRSA